MKILTNLIHQKHTSIKEKYSLAIFELIFNIIGYGILIVYYWKIAIAVFFIHFGINIHIKISKS